MPKQPMKSRVIRVPDSLWTRAKQRADERGETVSEAVRRFLHVYAENDVPNEVLIRAAYALLLASDTTHEAPADAVRWHKERETFMVSVQRQILSKDFSIPL